VSVARVREDFARLLRVPAPTPERIAGLHSQAILLKRLITDLRDLSLAQAGQLQLHRRTIDAAGVVRETLEALAPLADERTVGLRVEAPAHLPPVNADPDRLRQVVQNLVENALRHTPPGTRIAVRLEGSSATGAHLSVEDDGAGVAEADLPHLTDRFYRGESSRTTPGNGLGLSLVRAVAHRHHATVALADNRPGLRVRLEFPEWTTAAE